MTLTRSDSGIFSQVLHWRHWHAVQPPRPPRQPLSVLRGHLGDARELETKCVVVFGLGAVGGVAFLNLARMGVGTLVGVDLDCFGEDSWRTQQATSADAGRSKASALGEMAHRINPAIDVHTARGFAQEVPLRWLRRADVLVVAGDNVELPVWAGQRAAALRQRLIQGAVHGETWTAFVRIFDLREASAACPACGLSRREWQRLGSRHGCDPALARVQGREPTRTLPHLCGTAGHLLTGEIVKQLAGADAGSPRSREIAHCGLTHRTWVTEFTRNPDCRCPHEVWHMEDAGLPDVTTLKMLAQRLSLQSAKLSVRAEKPWFSSSRCADCGTEAATLRFARPGDSLGRCPCGGQLLAAPLAMRGQMQAADVQYCTEMPLSELGLDPGAAIGLRSKDDWTYFQLGQADEEDQQP